MTRITKLFIPVMAACLAITLFSCNNDGDKKEEKMTDEKKPDSTPPVAAFKPFKLIVIQHKVANFAAWKAGYMAHDSMRKAYGISQYRLGRGLEDSNMVIAIDIINDFAKAKEFVSSPDLKAAMQKAGVIGAPTISYLEVLRNDSSTIDQKERVLVSHKVKDYNTWLKAYDNEGVPTRLANGMIDRALGRGLEDSNMVYIAFAISDMAKAKARFASPDLKKIMTDAGVISEPKSFLYRIVQ
jgi:hypothetical protein